MSSIEQQLSSKHRKEIETRLAKYSIPLQILQMVADRCDCIAAIEISRRELSGPKKAAQLAALNDKSIALLEDIFLECHDSCSNFRFAAYLSSKYAPYSYKFIMEEKIKGRSGVDYFVDVAVHRRETGELVVIGMQNKDAGQDASDNKSVRNFLTAVEDLCAANPDIHSACYASSYGYESRDPSRLIKRDEKEERKIEIKFLEYQDGVYFESKSY